MYLPNVKKEEIIRYSRLMGAASGTPAKLFGDDDIQLFGKISAGVMALNLSNSELLPKFSTATL